MRTLLVFALLLTLGLSDASSAIADPQEMPQVKKKVEPLYPSIFKRAGIEGEVMIKVLVNEQGKVEKAEAVKATKPEFAEASLTAIKQWDFIPASKDGKPIKAEVLVPINFRLGDKAYKSRGDELFKAQDQIIQIIKGETSDSLKDFIGPEAYAVVDNKYQFLFSLIFEKSKSNPLVEGRDFKMGFADMRSSVSEDAAVLVMKSASGKAKRDRFDTVVLMKTPEGVWKIHSWHMSR